MLAIAIAIACSRAPEPTALDGQDPGARHHDPVAQDQQHPPIPAHDPIWEWDAGGFVGHSQWYGEHSWTDVRMRVAGHMTIAGRDLARIQASRGDLEGAAATWHALHTDLMALDIPDEGVAGQLVAVVRAHAQREAELLDALAAGSALPTRTPGTLGAARVAVLGLSANPDPQQAKAAQADLEELLDERPDLDLDAFEDFDARHELRVRLYEAALDSGDPLGLEEPWGYWEASELRRQALILGYVAGRLGGDDWSSRVAELDGTPPELDGDPLRWPSLVADALRTSSETFTPDGLGWLPTGDSLIDIGAQPGPRAIGTLSKLGLDDEAHVSWLQAEADALNLLLADDIDAVPGRIRQTTAALDAHEHGSRYYNVKQARNEAVRQLARNGRPDLALEVLSGNYPLHNQDWACPNREGILQALEGRLLAEAGRLDEAEAKLSESLQTSRDFVNLVDQAAAAPPGGGPGASPPVPDQGPPKGPPPRR
ncbi:MAG TPA: hypothetical protein QGF58_17195 [Myxococcota bacterium]|nr:hypothetical protein [Myxococcota bacterium]